MHVVNLQHKLDQFEETFRFANYEDDPETKDNSMAFIRLLLEAYRQTEAPIYVVLTMRSDFLGDCAHRKADKIPL